MKREVIRLRKETLVMLDKVFDTMYSGVPFPEAFRTNPLDGIILNLCVYYLNNIKSNKLDSERNIEYDKI